MHHGLCDLGPDTANQTVRAHKPCRRDGLKQMLRGEGVDSRDDLLPTDVPDFG
jgi:hypothetical protein